MKPCLQLNFCCGCGEPLHSLADARAHSLRRKHSVTFVGSLILKEAATDSESPLGGLIRFVCGCGFITVSLEKAKEHVWKTKHNIKVFGRIPKPSLKEGAQWGKPQPSAVPTPVLVGAGREIGAR